MPFDTVGHYARKESAERKEQISAMRSTASAIERLDVKGLIDALNSIANAINRVADKHGAQ